MSPEYHKPFGGEAALAAGAAERTRRMVGILNAIDFRRSTLPREVLEHKTDARQPSGDLEYSVSALCRLLQTPVSALVDLKPLDEKLEALAHALKDAIEQGDLQASYAAKAGLLRGVNEIRNHVPRSQPELAKLFVEQNTAYLEGWLTLVSTARSVDGKERNLVMGRQELANQRNACRKSQEEFRRIVLAKDSEEALAFFAIRDNDLPQQRLLWTDAQRNVHRKMVEMALEKNVLDLRTIKLDQDEQEIAIAKTTLNMLFTSVSSVPVVVDPGLMTKQREEIDRMMHQLVETDAQIDESLRAMDDLEGRLAQLETAPGALRAKELAARTEQQVAQSRSAQDSGEYARKLEERRRKFGLYAPGSQPAPVQAAADAAEPEAQMLRN